MNSKYDQILVLLDELKQPEITNQIKDLLAYKAPKSKCTKEPNRYHIEQRELWIPKSPWRLYKKTTEKTMLEDLQRVRLNNQGYQFRIICKHRWNHGEVLSI